MIILESIKVTEINAKDVVSEHCTQSNEFPVTIFRVLIVVSGSERKKIVIPIFKAKPEHQLLGKRDIHGFCSIEPLEGSPGFEDSSPGAHEIGRASRRERVKLAVIAISCT